MKEKISKYFFVVLQIGLGILFIYASYYKIVSPGGFAHQIYNYKLLPPSLINPVALVLPWVQLLCGLGLLINRWTLGASFLVVLMILVFQFGLASALIRDLNIACGCFKTGGSPATWWTFARDSLLLFSALLQYGYRAKKWNSKI